MSPPRVKICGITRANDLDAAVRAGADALGFVFTPRSPRHLAPQQAAGLVAAVPAFVTPVGLFMDQDADEVRRTIERLPLGLLQFHGRENGAYCRQFGLPYLKALSGGDPAAVGRAQAEYGDAAALLLDSHEPGGAGGTGKTFDWDSIPRLSRPLILAGGLNPNNVHRAVSLVRPWAVDVSSGVEDAPGEKSEQKMIDFIREAKRES